MAITFYDAGIDEIREATQEDWDKLFLYVCDKHKKLEKIAHLVKDIKPWAGDGTDKLVSS